MRQKYQKRGGFRNAPSTSEGSALRKPRAKQGNRFLAHPLPSTARRRTPARCCTRCLAYAPTTTSLARYSAGRAKQHNHARNVKPLPPRGSPGRAVPAALSGPGGLHCRRQCPGERPYTSAPLCHWAVPAPLSVQSFCAAHSTMPRGSFPVFSSSPWPDLPAGARLLASFWQKKEETPSLYAL